ncbi:MAG TPA: amidohydrolase family protein, partial [Candidatus Acidoferrales bacterium]|nr:amidohydrolase family protein [Candidatus Acidoferrales bacterium]
CDAGYFSVEQSRLVLEAGQKAGLMPRVHADELAHSGGSLLAAELGAASADHLLLADERDARALAAAGVSAVLCPGTALSLGKLPPARRLLEAGVTLALGSDHNPGTSGLVGVAPAIALAVAALGLSVEEALLAATAGGAASLRLGDRGVVEAGRRADLVAWDADHEGAFAWAFGLRARRVWLGGQA